MRRNMTCIPGNRMNNFRTCRSATKENVKICYCQVYQERKIIFIFQITMFHKMCQDYKVGMTPFVMPKLAIIISNSRTTTNIN